MVFKPNAACAWGRMQRSHMCTRDPICICCHRAVCVYLSVILRVDREIPPLVMSLRCSRGLQREPSRRARMRARESGVPLTRCVGCMRRPSTRCTALS